MPAYEISCISGNNTLRLLITHVNNRLLRKHRFLSRLDSLKA